MKHHAEPSAKEATLGLDPSRLLVVNDDVSNRDMLSRRLIRRGYSVEVAGDGPEALRKIGAAQYDLVLLDQLGASMSGLDLLRLLRATHSQSDLPVIMLTPCGHGGSAVDALENGANDYVAKPLDLPNIVARIQAQLARATAERHTKRLDPLTGLGNRMLLMQRLESVLHQHRENPVGWVAVMLLDLDGFKALNDSFGHFAGDGLLIAVAACLRKVLQTDGRREALLVSRFGGDEFVVLFENMESPRQIQDKADEILSALRALGTLRERYFSVTASAGIALSLDGKCTGEELLGDADLAMCRARERGRDRCELFGPALRERANGRMAASMDLASAVERKQLVAYYQPKIYLPTGAIVGFEALLRWQHPERGMIMPADFIPLAEETGLIIQLGEWVLRQACWQLKRWQLKFPSLPPLSMNVNISVKQLKDPSLVYTVRQILAETGIRPETLNFELTESVLMTDLEAAQDVLSRFRALHIGLKLDDFGTGYSSLSYLQMLQFDSLKIDRSFVSRLPDDRESCAIVETMLQLANTLKMSVVAEGIETQGQLKALLAMGCTIGQGYYFARPMGAERAEELLQNAVAA